MQPTFHFHASQQPPVIQQGASVLQVIAAVFLTALLTFPLGFAVGTMLTEAKYVSVQGNPVPPGEPPGPAN